MTYKFLYTILFSFTTLLVNPEPLTAMPLKYQAEVDAFSPTEDDWKEFDLIDNKPCFRWVFSNPKDERNFNPRYKFPEVLQIAQRKNNSTYKGWALSFHETLQSSIDALKYFTGNKKQMYLKLGTHIAEGVITSKDGITEIKCDDYLHFNHFEYEGTDFYADDRFVEVETVIKLP